MIHIYFDLDSTLTRVESPDILAQHKNCIQECTRLTKQVMDGDIPFRDAHAHKIGTILKPSQKDIAWQATACLANLTPGTRTFLKRFSHTTCGIISHSLRTLVTLFGADLGIPADRCYGTNAMWDHTGSFMRYDMTHDLAYDDGKSRILRTLRTQYPRDIFIFVGDSFGDMQTMDVVDTYIAYVEHVQRPRVISCAKYQARSMHELASIIHSVYPSSYAPI